MSGRTLFWFLVLASAFLTLTRAENAVNYTNVSIARCQAAAVNSFTIVRPRRHLP